MLILCLIPLLCFAPNVSEIQQIRKTKKIIDNVLLYKELSQGLNKNLDGSFPIRSPIKVEQIHRISDTYGWRMCHPITKKIAFHHGIDFAVIRGTTVYATANGIVTEANWKNGFGKQIIIDHGNGYLTRYAHLSKINVNVNDSIRYSEIIGYSGNTGISTGPHLHYEIIKNGRTIDPIKFLINEPSKNSINLYLNVLAKTNKIAWLYKSNSGD